jgi:hypothetical protein
VTALRRFRRLSASDRLVTLEAAGFLALAAACIALAPFRILVKFASRSPRGMADGSHAVKIGLVRSAIARSARRMPFRAKCFEQGLAAVWMLRRRGVATTLHYGIAKQDGKLVSHVWVTVGECAVVGGENSDAFSELACFPER